MPHFITIGEVASKVGAAPSAIRFWEKHFPIIQPVKRSGGRRYYSEIDVAHIAKIRNLLHNEGFTIKTANEYMKQKKAESLQTDIFEVLDKPNEAQKKSLLKVLDKLKDAKSLLANA
jgi:DNA-binding transcriptional MerR regulator